MEEVKVRPIVYISSSRVCQKKFEENFSILREELNRIGFNTRRFTSSGAGWTDESVKVIEECDFMIVNYPFITPTIESSRIPIIGKGQYEEIQIFIKAQGKNFNPSKIVFIYGDMDIKYAYWYSFLGLFDNFNTADYIRYVQVPVKKGNQRIILTEWKTTFQSISEQIENVKEYDLFNIDKISQIIEDLHAPINLSNVTYYSKRVLLQLHPKYKLTFKK